MSLVPTLFNAAVVAAVAAIVAYIGKGRFDSLEKRLDRFEDHVEQRFGQVSEELRALRSDLTQVALAVGARPRPQTG